MTQTQHTQTPWKILRTDVRDSAEYTYVIGINPIDMPHCTLRLLSVPRYNEEDEANATFIVRACNSYEDMLAFIEKVEKCDLANFIPDIQAEAFALIMKVRG